jgi:hypothetical protein
VKAPEKQLVWFEHSGHIPMTEAPGKFLVSLVLYARPIAEKAGELASLTQNSWMSIVNEEECSWGVRGQQFA